VSLMFENYLHLRALGVRRAWCLSGMNTVARRLLVLVFWFMVLTLCVTAAHLRIEHATNEARHAVGEVVSSQAAEIKALSNILASCLGDKEGAIYIGGELYLCGASRTGIKR